MRSYADALAEAQRLGFAEADPTDDVSGADAAAKMAILATVAFGSRVTLDDVDYRGIEAIPPEHRRGGARARDGRAARRRRDARRRTRSTCASGPRSSTATIRSPRSRARSTRVMLQGDAIREITLEGPGAGGIETASAVVADLVSIIGTTGTGFLQNDPCWRSLERMPPGDLRSPFYLHLEVDDRPGVLARCRAAARGARRLGRAAHAAAGRRRRGAPRRHPRGAAARGRGRARGDRGARRDPRGAALRYP